MKFLQHKKIILASGSPRRKAYLEKYHLQFDVVTGNIDETVQPGETPEGYSRRMASEKAEAVIHNCDNEAFIIAADTIVVFEGVILGKPASKSEVFPMLQKLNGNSHQVITAYQIRNSRQAQELSKSVTTDVRFNRLSDDLLKAYAECTEPLDKAGAYSIQGLGTLLVHSINGSYNNVVGLPIEVLFLDLMDLGVISTK